MQARVRMCARACIQARARMYARARAKRARAPLGDKVQKAPLWHEEKIDVPLRFPGRRSKTTFRSSRYFGVPES
jgi:hypothetical protein